ncbi:MAG: hypothetical protein JWP85_1482 [Rhodoglobus sp.]|nr:hypothetical protein [Rhodoglobus sp.]
MSSQTQHLSTYIERSATAVYEYASDPANLPDWASGLAGSIELVGGEWISESPMGRITIEMAEPNNFGVIDHWVTLPTGERVYNPMRVVPHGEGCEVVFHLRRQPGTTDDAFEADAILISSDLASLKTILEG